MALALLAFAFASCQDAKYAVPENLLYIGDTDGGKIKSVLLDSDGAVTNLSIRMAKAADKDIRVKVSIDEKWLEEYNEVYDASYLPLPSENYTFESELVIPEGSVSSSPLKLQVKAFDPRGAQYAIPVRITSGDANVNESTSKYIVAIVKPLIQKVPKMGGKNGMQAEGQFPIELPNYTLECLIKMSGFNINNQAFFNCGGGSSELYCRFGDLVYANEATGKGYLYNYIQVKTMGGQLDSGDPNDASLALIPNTWIHFAITRDSASGENKLYKDGELVGTLTNAPGRNMVTEAFQIITSDYDSYTGNCYFVDDCEMCQVRFWKTTRSQAQIKKNMRSEVKYDDPDLILYLPMNEGGGDTLHDVTGHGYNCTFGTLPSLVERKVGRKDNVTWSEYEFK